MCATEYDIKYHLILVKVEEHVYRKEANYLSLWNNCYKDMFPSVWKMILLFFSDVLNFIVLFSF